MGSLIYSAVGTQNMLGAAFKKIDPTKLDPARLMNVSGPGPTPAEAQANAKLPLAQELRAQLLDMMGLTEGDILQMRSETRADLEDQIARHLHQEVKSRADVQPGAFVDLKT